MFESFAHYLSYGATDQRTLIDLAGKYHGVVVPGTIAAYQRQGTGGFVLSLSATAGGPPYVIDPRFPLFQQRLRSPKQSHEALAELFGYPDLVETRQEPQPGDFSRDALREMAERWVEFNLSYDTAESSAFKKYAKRLGEQLPQPENIQTPQRVLTPYFMADGPDDPWWDLSEVLWEATRTAAGEHAVRVVAAKTTDALPELLDATDEPELVIWVSGFDEIETGYRELRAYAQALERTAKRGVALFALYGGFYHVLLGLMGLRGHSHGIGFGEYRVWEELPQSGPPPARYYLRRAHRYVPQDLAQQLWRIDATLTECNCADCRDRSPLELDYHALMRHSVAARSEEIGKWSGVQLGSVAKTLREEYEALRGAFRKPLVPRPIQQSALRYIDQLDTWANAFDPPGV